MQLTEAPLLVVTEPLPRTRREVFTPRRDLPNLRSLDALRGILATYVVLHHARWLLWAGQTEWVKLPHSVCANAIAYASSCLRYGHEAVMIFFALSGFFIHLRFAQKLADCGQTQLNSTKFYARRVHRLLAPYALALVVTAVLDVFGNRYFPVLYSAHSGNSMLDELFKHKGYSPASVVPAICLVPSALGRDFGTNGPLWSLAYEVLYYLVYPIWSAVRLKSGVLAFAVIPLLCLGATFIPVHSFPLEVFSSYAIWLGGAYLAELWCRGRVETQSIGFVIFVFFVAFALLHCLTSAWSVLLADIALGVTAVWCFSLVPKNWPKRRWHRALEYLGIRSYTTYIMHFPVLVLMSSCIMTATGGLPLSGWLGAAGTLLTLGICIGLFEICEKHFLHARLAVTPKSCADLRPANG